MKKRTGRKLALAKETLVALQADGVQGGEAAVSGHLTCGTCTCWLTRFCQTNWAGCVGEPPPGTESMSCSMCFG